MGSSDSFAARAPVSGKMLLQRCGAALLCFGLFGVPALAQTKIAVVATFSILGDFARVVGGGRIDLTTLVGPDGDAHVYQPTPADAQKLSAAKLVITNGLGFEGWIERLTQTSATKARFVFASTGVTPRQSASGHAGADPHAWQNIANAKTYVTNIRDALDAVDPDGKGEYDANSAAYLAELDKAEAEIRAAIASIPPARRRAVSTHDAFGYFWSAYGLTMLAPQGVSTDAEPNAQDLAKLIRFIRAEKVPAVFLENVTDPRQIKRIAAETGAKVGGTLYSDALSQPGGPAATYLEMMRSNARVLAEGLRP